MTDHRITRDDLNWWLSLAPTLAWSYARTYAETAPHHYIVLGRTEGLAKEDYVRAARVIHTFGSPQKFYGMTSIYLASADGRLKWWTMDRDVTETALINQATTDRLYGVQNAPATESHQRTCYDAIATAYDQDHPAAEELAEAVQQAVATLRGHYPPAVLDVGCGTGRTLDLAVTTPDRYAGVDPSNPMLNQLVRKHPDIAALYPMKIEQALATDTFTPGQFEIVTLLLDDADHLEDDTFSTLTAIASQGLILARGTKVTIVKPHCSRSATKTPA